MHIPVGANFHGEFSSADASALSEANSRFTLYQTGTTTALTLDPNDQVIVTDFILATGASAITTSLYDGADATVGAGELILKSTSLANTTNYPSFFSAHFCQKGTYPKVKTSGAGQIDVVIKGTIIRIGS